MIGKDINLKKGGLLDVKGGGGEGGPFMLFNWGGWKKGQETPMDISEEDYFIDLERGGGARNEG